MSHEQDPCIWRINGIESVLKSASKVCLNQWSRDTKYQDMLEVWNII